MNSYAYEAIIHGINDCLNKKQNEPSAFEKDIDELDDEENEGSEEELNQDDEEEANESEEDDQDDIEEQEQEKNIEDARKNIRRRPETAFSQRRSKRFKPSTKTQNKIINLRHLQKLNADKISESDQPTEKIIEEINIKTAIDRIVPFQDDLINNKEESIEETSNDEDNDEESEEEVAFVRDVQTVKLNEHRKPLIEQSLPAIDPDETTKSSETQPLTKNESNGNSNFVENNIFQRKVNESSNEINKDNSSSTRTKSMSERERRIAEQVKLMKQRQMSHEKRKALINQFKPVLICGGFVVGGYLIFQIYKNLFA